MVESKNGSASKIEGSRCRSGDRATQLYRYDILPFANSWTTATMDIISLSADHFGIEITTTPRIPFTGHF